VRAKLVPAQQQLGDRITVQLVPYGKAETSRSGSGRLTFDCQHGPSECEGNKMHACMGEVVKEQGKRVAMAACMIDDNSEAMGALNRCEHILDNRKEMEEIIACYSAAGKGDELLEKMGVLTHALSPSVTFIPTVTIDHSQEDQMLIQRSLTAALCKKFSPASIPSVCNK